MKVLLFCSALVWSTLEKDGLHPNFVQEIYWEERIQEEVASAGVEKGSSQLNRHWAYVELLRAEFFQGEDFQGENWSGFNA